MIFYYLIYPGVERAALIKIMNMTDHLPNPRLVSNGKMTTSRKIDRYRERERGGREGKREEGQI